MAAVTEGFKSILYEMTIDHMMDPSYTKCIIDPVPN